MEVVVGVRHVDHRPWMVDLCEKCYQRRFGDLRKMSRPAPRVNIAKVDRSFQETPVLPENL